MTRFTRLTLVVLACPAAVMAAELKPGQGGHGSFEPDQPVFTPTGAAPWTGDVIATRTDPFNFTYDVPAEDGGGQYFSRGTFTSSVLRNAQTGKLAFRYELNEEATNHVNDLESVVIQGFTGFTTDVYAFDRPEDDFSVGRPPDGDPLIFGFNLEGVDGQFLVLTDATQYVLRPAATGFHVGMDFASGGDTSAAFAAFGPSTVPEPAAGLLLAVAGGALLRRRR
jgi:hypothetical protein